MEFRSKMVELKAIEINEALEKWVDWETQTLNEVGDENDALTRSRFGERVGRNGLPPRRVGNGTGLRPATGRYPSAWSLTMLPVVMVDRSHTPLLLAGFLLDSCHHRGTLALPGHRGFGKVERRDERTVLGLWALELRDGKSKEQEGEA